MAPAMPCKRNKQQSSIVKTNIMQKQMFMRTSAKQCKLYGGISRVKKHEDRIARIHLLWHKKILHKFYRIWRSQEQKGCYSGSTKRHKETKSVHVASLMDKSKPKKCRARTQIAEVYRQSRTQKRHCKRQFRRLRSLHWTRLICITDDCCEDHGRYCKFARLWKTNSWCSICLHPGSAPKSLKIPKSECPDVWIRFPRHKWRKIMGKIEDPVVLLEQNLHGHPLAGLLWERQCEKALLDLGWEKVRTGNACSFIVNKAYFCP